MKIAFQGFRGFGKKYEFLEISDLTILTGKNSSGKSTFIKLLKLLCEAFEEVNNLQDLANIKINIANEIIGGKESLKSLQKVSQAKFVFTTKFEFFIDFHEIHINFEITDYFMRVKTVEIYDEYSLKINKPLFILGAAEVILNIKHLFSKYNKYAILYNVFEEYRYKKYNSNWEYNKEGYSFQFDNVRNEIGLTDDKIETEIQNHISGRDDGCVIPTMVDLFRNEEDYPFKVDNYIDGNSFHILCIMEEKIELTRSEIVEFIAQSEFTSEVNSFITEVKLYDPSYDFVAKVLEWYNFEIENFILTNREFDINVNTEFSQAFNWLNNGFFEFYKDGEIGTDFYKNIGTVSLDCGGELFNKLINKKIQILYSLGKGTCQIFQNYIIKVIKSLSRSKFQSNVRNLPERSYNIYNSDSIFSAFIKQWKLLDKKERNIKIVFIKNYLNQFEIADDIRVKFDNNIGFLQLIKKGNQFSIIDEGSGISNILSCLLFIAQNLFVFEDKNEINNFSAEDKQMLVFEEPESNLHPSLQSLLADLFVDIITKYDMRLIIETHSEYFIRKLQFLVAKKKVENSSISLNYFDISYPKNSPVISFKKIPISKDGILEDEFGPGFFDEANNLSINLFQLNQTQNN
jgi:predicted ATPase